MSKLEEMWTALEKYQKYADADGHGKTWALMCELKTAEAAHMATLKAAKYRCPADYDGTASPAMVAADSAYRETGLAADISIEYYDYAQYAIDRINDVLRLKEMTDEN